MFDQGRLAAFDMDGTLLAEHHDMDGAAQFINEQMLPREDE